MPLPLDITKPDSRIQSVLSEIEKIELELIENKSFIGQDVYLDGRDFVNCVFQYCTIHVKLGHFKIRGKIQLKNNVFKLYPPAEAVKSIFDTLALQK